MPHASLSSPHTLSSQLREMFTHKSRGVVVANGLGIAKSCKRQERGSEVAEGGRGILEKGKEEGLPVNCANLRFFRLNENRGLGTLRKRV